MPIKIICPSCSTAYTVSDALIGKKGKCKKCGSAISIQAESTATQAPLAASRSSSSRDEFDVSRTMAAPRTTVNAGADVDEFDRGQTVRPAPLVASAKDDFDHWQTVRATPMQNQNGNPQAGMGSTGSEGRQKADGAWEMKAGDILAGRYLITKRIGRGGMGAVYKAVDQETENEVAVKLLLPELAASPDAMRDLKKEVAIAEQLTHQNLLRVNYLGTTGDRAFLVMEYLDGEDLEAYRLRKGGKISEEELRRILPQLLAGLDYLHERGMVHLDIKPQNVMVSKAGEVKLTDFGISRTIKEQLAARTEAQAPVGTLCYMAPEQLRGEVCDRRTDIYAIGIMIYQLLMGNFPFPTATREEIVAWHLGPGFKSTAMPSNWYDIVQHCVSRRQADRYPNCTTITVSLSGQSVDSSDDASSSSRREITNLISLADAELQGGSPSGAEKYYLRVLEIDPKNTEAWFGRVKTYLATRNPSEPASLLEAERVKALLARSIVDGSQLNEQVVKAICSFVISYVKRLDDLTVYVYDEIKAVYLQRAEAMELLSFLMTRFSHRAVAQLAHRAAEVFKQGIRCRDGFDHVWRKPRGIKVRNGLDADAFNSDVDKRALALLSQNH
jgi:predicted Zn finger-like uncharacterized protein